MIKNATGSRKKPRRFVFPRLRGSVKSLDEKVDYEMEEAKARQQELWEEYARRITEAETTIQKMVKAQKKNAERIDTLIDLVEPFYSKEDNVQSKGMTPQEQAWFGKHGFRYVVHHLPEDWRKTRIPFWSMILDLMPEINSVCEFGANIGANLKAIRDIRPDITPSGIELNPFACDILRRDGFEVTQSSISSAPSKNQYNLVFTRGVLIHVKPSDLEAAMRTMASYSSKYVMIYEHYSDEIFTLDGYNKAVSSTMGERGEGYQFWADYSGRFSHIFPDWRVLRSGVRLTPDAPPKHGDLHWTIFRRPDLGASTS